MKSPNEMVVYKDWKSMETTIDQTLLTTKRTLLNLARLRKAGAREFGNSLANSPKAVSQQHAMSVMSTRRGPGECCSDPSKMGRETREMLPNQSQFALCSNWPSTRSLPVEMDNEKI
jgi:hypothetical protein